MNYLKDYCNLIRKVEHRVPPEGYTERHHIFPKSIYGNNNRIVVLTAREHYIAHAFLVRIFSKRYGIDDWKTIKMIKAFWCMNNKSFSYKSILYESAKIDKVFSMKINNPGKTEKSKIIARNNFLKNNPSKKPNNAKLISERMKENNPMKKQEVLNKICKYKYKIITPINEIIITNNLNSFCKKHNIDTSAMNRVAHKKANHHKNYKVEII